MPTLDPSALATSSLLLLAALCASGSSRSAAAVPVSPPPQFLLTATIQDLMQGVVDPAADALWDSVAYIASTSGTLDRRPRSAAEWQAVRLHAVTLIEATNLLKLPGRPVKTVNSPVGVGELAPAEIGKRIAASPDTFARFADVLRAAGQKALAAIDAKDAQGLMDAGGVIDEACEACHLTYWYPDQYRPRP